MADLPAEEPRAPYAARWSALKVDNRPWSDGETAQEFIRGALHPLLAKELYSSSSKVLVERAAMRLVWMDLDDALQKVNLKLRAKGSAEVVAATEERATTLKGEDVQTAKAMARAAEEERLRLPERVEEAIAGYKASVGFEHGLVRSSRVMYEYEYRVARAHFWGKFLDLDLESDPFVEDPADQDVDMPTNVPFDDGPPTPPSG
ncbi:hypothetical protein C4D60_Mb08t06350 [Musa balbisiana]|uniref:Uncharacterized protein n=1 Tax=Musa balbisiana TaxID=52838 RepID=A0A4V4H8Q6_MUSBA|nr:hypothetical protein C4D60_Mb08t06350 [Musa balbisiana]